ncbi:MAG: hypothetical protein L6Q74_06270 [Sphaerotilus natans subsp. sulfidivorans]|jgi:hypothetical protein|nr:hypothetical protein [Sphaerotilus sulfidivorans]MCK6401497.1 hypothetical protein [Sphaerotilus sulfidivorans]
MSVFSLMNLRQQTAGRAGAPILRNLTRQTGVNGQFREKDFQIAASSVI